MSTYDIDADGYLLGEVNPERGAPGPISVPPPAHIDPAHCRWDGAAWIDDPSRSNLADAESARKAAVDAMQRMMDDYARSWGYDDIRSACTYVGDPVPRFNAEGIALRNWRSAVWVAAESASATVTTVEQLFAALPPPPARPT